MKKHLVWVLVLVLLLSCTACAAQEMASSPGFTFTEEGKYDFAAAPPEQLRTGGFGRIGLHDGAGERPKQQ